MSSYDCGYFIIDHANCGSTANLFPTAIEFVQVPNKTVYKLLLNISKTASPVFHQLTILIPSTSVL